MSLDPALLIRRWPERRPVVLAVAACGFAAVAAAVEAVDPALAALYVLPVMLAALELGLIGGLVAAAVGTLLMVVSGVLAPALAAVVVGAVAGRFSDRMRAVHARERRLLGSGLVLGNLAAHDRLPQAVADAALATPGALGAEVTVDGAGRAVAGRMQGRRTGTDILARGVRRGRIVVAHRGPLDPEERAALELLALQAGLAADNHRLLAQEREAAALEAELLEQRDGLGRLLDAQEDDRRRLADTLHEELAQALAATLLSLRMLRRHGVDGSSLDELHAQVAGVLAELREAATSLRPSSLEQLGLVPALEALDDVTVEADGVPVPEPLRTGVYRLLEHLARPGARVHLAATDDGLEVAIDVRLDDAAAAIGAARARVALLNGAIDEEPLPDGRTRVRARFPAQLARAVAAAPTGSAARTTVRPGADSISS